MTSPPNRQVSALLKPAKPFRSDIGGFKAWYWTIGYGHLCDPKHSPITEAEAEVYLALNLQSALAATLHYCPALATEPERRLAAIVDFTFKPRRGAVAVLRQNCNAGSMAEESLAWACGPSCG